MSDAITAVLIVAGTLFCLLAAVGMIRLPDSLTRMHAATKAGTLGAGLILAAVALRFAEIGIVLRAAMTLLFLYLTAPVAAHLIGRAAYRSGAPLSSETWVDHLSEDIRSGRVTGPATDCPLVPADTPEEVATVRGESSPVDLHSGKER